jgi:hypothetical protein
MPRTRIETGKSHHHRWQCTANPRYRQKKIRARRGACVALGAMSFIDVADINKLTDDELEGLQEPDLDGTDPTPATDLEDYMITLNPPKSVTVATVEMETAGFGGIFTSIGKLVASIFKAGKAISKAATMFKGAARSGGGERFAKLRNRDTNGPASKVCLLFSRQHCRVLTRAIGRC